MIQLIGIRVFFLSACLQIYCCRLSGYCTVGTLDLHAVCMCGHCRRTGLVQLFCHLQTCFSLFSLP
ncbi:hypothetical protein T4B_8872 [Trichinella pseudospiralis]|uniref:Secreted protein n=1 Tax=Trichinella pseudospiralis TaxID=6337 RepID=A0A0V1IY57_TRIPS|nr:hypothetical protein T4B_8872 [Trichinella pseudospiralis]